MQALMLVQLTILNNLFNKFLELVSVIIVTKNHSKYLKKCLRSILNQTYKNIEIIIIDHNSSDDTAEIVYSFKTNKVKYFLYKKNKGIADVRNFGIQNSKGEYIFFTDADCIATSNWIEEGINFFLKEDVVGVEGKTVAEYQNYGASEHFVENYLGGQYQTCNMAYKRRILLEFGMFNEKYKTAYEDVDLALRIKKKYSIKFNSNMLIFHQLVKWTLWSLITNALRGKDKVMLVKDHNYQEILKFKILEINSLIIILFPFLLIFYYRIKSFGDLIIIPFFFIRAILHRIIIWKAALENKILIF